jgi:hypothetical protein
VGEKKHVLTKDNAEREREREREGERERRERESCLPKKGNGVDFDCKYVDIGTCLF